MRASGFRCYSREYIKKALPKLHSQTYEIQIETLRQAKLLGFKVGEKPSNLRKQEKGKIKANT
jgi:hypothetical protein